MEIGRINSSAFRLVRRLFRCLLTIVLAFLLSGSLLRFSPGWNVEETDLDPRFSAPTVNAVREERATDRGLFKFYSTYLGQVASGDFGISELFRRPVGELVAERAATTLRSVAAGLLAGWVLALVLATATSRDRTGVGIAGATSVSGALLSCPSGLLAVACLVLRLPPAFAITAVVFPRVFAHAHEQLRFQLRTSHVLMAKGRGISEFRLFIFHVVPGALPALIALAGASAPIAFGAAIPIESLADSPGLGQLAWRATLGRDMPLLVGLTLLLTLVSVTANLLADVTLAYIPGRRR